MTTESASSTPTIFNPTHLHDPTPNGYSTAVITAGRGRLAFVSGQGGQDRIGQLSPDFGAQVVQAYANLAAVLEALGASPDRVVKLTVFVVDHDMSKLGVLTETVMRMFGGGVTRADAGSGAEACHRPDAVRGRGRGSTGLSGRPHGTGCAQGVPSGAPRPLR